MSFDILTTHPTVGFAMNEQPLLSPLTTGIVPLKNRVVMSSMTRGRARNAELAPTDLHVEYYRQRATAGLILTEGIWVSPKAIGFIHVPGLYSPKQVEAWRHVTDAVHGEGSRIFAQLAHAGAVSHPDFFNGVAPVAPSAINPHLRAFTPDGFKETVTPRAMTIEEIDATVRDYAVAAANARSAGFDGVEIHCATTYLLPEFLSSTLNVREDAYGGSDENRARIVLQILDAVVGVWGPGRVGIKISPTLSMGGLAPTEHTVSTYDHLVRELHDRPLAHLQVVRAVNDLSGTPVAALQDTIAYYRSHYGGRLIANFGFDASSANELVGAGRADLVSFGKPFIANPDLVRRFRDGLPLAIANPETFYQGGAGGYTDYPT